MLGELLDLVLLERPDHERGEEAREDERRVPIGLAAGELELGGGQEQRHAAELGDPDLECDSGARRGLVEDKPDRPPGQNPQLASACALRLELVGEIEQRLRARRGTTRRRA